MQTRPMSLPREGAGFLEEERASSLDEPASVESFTNHQARAHSTSLLGGPAGAPIPALAPLFLMPFASLKASYVPGLGVLIVFQN